MYEKNISNQYDRMTQAGTRTFPALMRSVYLWMTLGLVMTGLTAALMAHNEHFIYALFTNQILFWGIAIAEIGLVIWLSAAAHKMSFSTMGILFAVYCVLNGLTMSLIFVAYTQESIAQAFFVTAGTFGAMSLVGLFIKRDLSGLGRILLMLLIGLIIASIVNIFLHNGTLAAILNYAGVLIFVGLTAYDTQKIRNWFEAAEAYDDRETMGKLALMGSLTLYLDFINLFLYMLRFFGRARD